MRARIALSVASAFFAVTGAYAQDAAKDMTFNGGPWDGITVGSLVRAGDGKPGFGLKPSVADASPVSGALAGEVKKLLLAYDAGDAARFKAALSPDATAEVCSDGLYGGCRAIGLPFGEQFAEHCTANTPYFMKDMGKVRIEWLYKGQLYYLSFLDVRGGRITHIKTIRADVPPMFNPEASKSNG